MMIELRDSEHALIDHIELYNFQVVGIYNFRALQNCGYLEQKENRSRYYCNGLESGFSSLKIGKTPYWDELRCGINFEARKYSCITMSVEDDGFHNLNCSTMKEYQNRITAIQEYLYVEYGIDTDFSMVKIRKMEINKTIMLVDPFRKYQRCLDLAFDSIPGSLRFRKACIYSDARRPQELEKYNHSNESYYLDSGKKGLGFKIYDKTNQLNKVFNLELENNYLRTEITLKSSTKIKNTFDTNELFQITDRQINEYFHDFIEKYLCEVYSKKKTERNKLVLNTLKKFYVPGNRGWIKNVLDEIVDLERLRGNVIYLLDEEEIVSLFDKMQFPNKNCKYYAKKQCREVIEKRYQTFNQNDSKKYEEILEKLMRGINESSVTTGSTK